MKVFREKGKPFRISKFLKLCPVLVALLSLVAVHAFGFDSANSCSPNGKVSRRGRAQMLATIPCDLTRQVYCHLPGAAYPWHAVRRFVHENQGLMKRMYGDMRHISVLRDEIQNNEIDIEDVETAADRYSRDGARRSSKFMHVRDDYGSIKSNDVFIEPHFRPVSTSSTSTTSTSSSSSSTTTTTTTTTTTPAPSIVSSTMNPSINSTKFVVDQDQASLSDVHRRRVSSTRPKPSAAGNAIPEKTLSSGGLSTEEALKANGQQTGHPANSAGSVDDVNLESNSVYESSAPSPSSGDTAFMDNIEIVDSPQLGLDGVGTGLTNISVASTISSTLKAVTGVKTDRRPTINRQRPSSQYQLQHQYHHQLQHQLQYQSQHHIQKIGSNNVNNNNNNNLASLLKESANLKSKPNESERPSSNSAVKGNIASTTLKITEESSQQSPLVGTTSTSSSTIPLSVWSRPPASASASPTPGALSSPVLPLKVNSELLSGEKLRKQTITTASPPINLGSGNYAANKPVLHDGQLFQDTVRQEPMPVVNLRGINACPVKEEVVAPFWANNTRGEVLALLNMYPFEQYVHWEKCTHEHKQMFCRDGCRCEQQYRLHRLLAYDPHNECRGIFSDWFRFPSCCICKCYNIPMEFRATSRSPRSEGGTGAEYRHPIEVAEEVVKTAIYEHAADEWYRPKDELSTLDSFDG